LEEGHPRTIHQIWLKLAQWFLRRKLKCESLRRTTDGLQVMAKAHIAFTDV
jgi:hypothetical protein